MKILTHFFYNPHINPVDNKIYPPPMDWKLALKLMDSNIPDEMLGFFTKKCIGDFPNTYTFTKNLGENLVNDHSHLFPIIIAKPSIIVFSLMEPEPSYVETYYGITGLSAFWGTGLMRTTYSNPDVHFDVVFLDLVVNLTLIKAAHMSLNPRKENPQVQLICSKDIHKFGLCTKNMKRTMSKYPFDKSIWYHGRIVLTTCYVYFVLRVIFYQIIPSLMLDQLMKSFGVKPMLMALQRKSFLGNKEIAFFAFHSFPNTGITDKQELKELAENTDFTITRHIFCLETEEGRKEIYNKFVLGCRRFLLNESDETLPYARIKMKAMKWIDWMATKSVHLVIAYIVYIYVKSFL
ncbi:hypothetical protein ACFFRR_000141 [Megaselia abdita]